MTKNWAIVIGINAYNPLNFTPLKYAKQDAERVKDFFQAVGFEVCFFTDDSPPLKLPNGHKIPTQPTYGNLVTFLQDRFNEKEGFLNTGDNCWFFFAGHGERHQDRDYLMPMDANSRGTEVIAGLPVSYVEERLSRCGADNIIMILDACRNEGQRGGIGIFNKPQKGLLKISSCQPTQKSWEIDDLQQGVFTYALLEALQLTGESNCATAERLGSYLENRVPSLCQQFGKIPAQIPRISADPIELQHFILFSKQAQEADINRLKLDAYRLRKINPTLAEQICIRLNALSAGKDLDVIELLTEVRNELKVKANEAFIQIPSSPPPNASPKELHECHFSKILFIIDVEGSDNDWAYTLQHIQKIGGAVESRVFELLLFRFNLLTRKRIKLEEDIEKLENIKSQARSSLELQAKGDLIVLIQHNRVTHVVEALDDEIRETEVGYVRWVRVVWMSEGNWSKLPPQEKILGFSSPGSVSLANSKSVNFDHTCWHSLEVFQKHIFNLLPTAEFLDIKTNNTDGDNLNSERFGLDYYARLRDFLIAKDWKAANIETRIRMQKLVSSSQYFSFYEKYPTKNSRESKFEKIPCFDLKNVDDLWVKYSQRKFGFSIQKEIWESYDSPEVTFGRKKSYEELQKDWERFGAAVGWRTKGLFGLGTVGWLTDSRLTFDLSAPKGHLPVLWGHTNGSDGIDGFGWDNTGFVILFSRLQDCDSSIQ
jgi:uncharacterized caspase-like protein